MRQPVIGGNNLAQFTELMTRQVQLTKLYQFCKIVSFVSFVNVTGQSKCRDDVLKSLPAQEFEDNGDKIVDRSEIMDKSERLSATSMYFNCASSSSVEWPKIYSSNFYRKSPKQS